MTIHPDEYYTFEEVVRITMERLGWSRRKAILMIRQAARSGELPSVTVEELRRANKIN